MRVYVAGPMTGILDHNFPAFHVAAKRWRDKGHMVFNPAESHGGDTTLALEHYARFDIHMLLQADAVALLPGWERSSGAKKEVLLAEWLGLMFFDAITMQAVAPRVTTTAEPLVRQAA